MVSPPYNRNHALWTGMKPRPSFQSQERDPRSGAPGLAAGEGLAPGAARSFTFQAAPDRSSGGETAPPAA
ncbi:unnamed protein product [Rangifer tarandus platyrhynchus]|uniref:Uncharacterized protein n=2 Tax=Rangifer tarandus platyrhynchus TaxID=3082113 RepID=A0ABN8ZLD1_RANTA|nr:unnamed protein product [Rangifer tarandus platyrhynchus]CAI9706753.1 unnamed protein product [Rangifer tarandus platyrhynchus]